MKFLMGDPLDVGPITWPKDPPDQEVYDMFCPLDRQDVPCVGGTCHLCSPFIVRENLKIVDSLCRKEARRK